MRVNWFLKYQLSAEGVGERRDFVMALPSVIAKLDDAPEALREHYVEKDVSVDGKSTKMFVLTVNPSHGFDLQDINGLKTTVQKLRTEKSDLETRFKPFASVDPELLPKALDTYDKVTKGEFTDQQKVEERLKARTEQMAKEHRLELEKREASAKKLKMKLEKEMIESVASRALAEEKGVAALLLPHIQRRTRLRENGDDYIVEVLTDNGQEVAVNGQGQPLSIQELVREYKASETFGRAFEGTTASGAGTGQSAGTSTGASQRTHGGVRYIDSKTGQLPAGVDLADLASGKVVRN